MVCGFVRVCGCGGGVSWEETRGPLVGSAASRAAGVRHKPFRHRISRERVRASMHAEASGQLPPLPEMGNSELLASPFTTVQVRQGATWGVVGRIVVMGYRIFTLPLL